MHIKDAYKTDMITHDMFFHSVATDILQQPEKVAF